MESDGLNSLKKWKGSILYRVSIPMLIWRWYLGFLSVHLQSWLVVKKSILVKLKCKV